MRSCSRSAAGVCATVRFGLAGAGRRGGRGLEPAHVAAGGERQAAHSSTGAAQRRRLIPFLRRPANSATSATRLSSRARALIPAQQLDLPHPEHFDSRPAARLDQAADTNPLIFEGLKDDAGSLERRQHAP